MPDNSTRRICVATIAVAGVLTTVGVGYAAIPSADGVIHGCYNAGSNPSGQLRVIDQEAGAKCAKNEKLLDFNQKGPKGDKGDKGDACLSTEPACVGPPGPAGDNGTNGSDGTNGNDGAPGAPGAPGPAGPSDAYIGRCDVCGGIGNPGKTLVKLDLPAGFYAVFAKTDIRNLDNDAQDAQCRLSTGESSIVRIGSVDTFAGTGEGVNQSQIVLQDLLTLNAPGSVAFSCSTFIGDASQAKITAIKIGALHG
jgi:hypothetical protein